VFASRFKDGTDFDPGPPPQIVNRNEINCRGAELALEWRLTSTWRVGSSLTYVNARRDPGDVRMRARPRWRGGVFTNWAPTAALTFTAAVTAIDRVPDSSIPTGDVWLEAWARCDLAARWQVREGWSATVAIDNILDADYEEAVGFPALGRTVRGGLRVDF
jgi:outer membrane receptor protein involved in Fe transport